MVLNPRIEHIEISKLNPDNNNPNKFSALMQQSLDYSIEKYGSLQLIIIDQDNNIVDGNHRYFSYKNNDVKDVDVIRVNIENKNDKYLISQTMNKIRGTHDSHIDAQIMQELIREDEKNMLELVRLTAAESENDIWKIINKSNNVDQSVDGYTREITEEEEETDKKGLYECPKCGYLFESDEGGQKVKINKKNNISN